MKIKFRNEKGEPVYFKVFDNFFTKHIERDGEDYWIVRASYEGNYTFCSDCDYNYKFGSKVDVERLIEDILQEEKTGSKVVYDVDAEMKYLSIKRIK